MRRGHIGDEVAVAATEIARQNMTAIFELTHPAARIIVAQDKPRLRLLHVRDNASGVYVKGDGRITLEVSDLAAAGAFAGMAGALNVESTKQTATGYEKIGKIDGRLTTEKFDSQAKSGQYSVIVANRFVVEANGSGVAMDDLKGAVSSVALGQLEGMAKS